LVSEAGARSLDEVQDGPNTPPSITSGHEQGTVGAVAIDRDGNLFAATSTGGTCCKLPGRVGDSPLIGCGCYADSEAGGVSCTGYGEAIMKVVLAKRPSISFAASAPICVDSPAASSCDVSTADMAAREAVHLFRQTHSRHRRLILLDRLGKSRLRLHTATNGRRLRRPRRQLRHFRIRPAFSLLVQGDFRVLCVSVLTASVAIRFTPRFGFSASVTRP